MTGFTPEAEACLACHPSQKDAETPDDLIGCLRLAAGRDYNVSGYNEDNRCLEDITPLLWKAARMIDRLNTDLQQTTGAKPGRQSSVGEPQPKDTK